MSHASIHLPVLFEVSGNTMVIGEKPLTETSYYNYRHQFTCGGGTANTTSTLLKNQFKYIDEVQDYVVTRSGGELLMNGTNQDLQLGFNVRYRFDVGDSSMTDQTLQFSTTSNGTHGAGLTTQELVVKVVDDNGTKKFSIDGANQVATEASCMQVQWWNAPWYSKRSVRTLPRWCRLPDVCVCA